jgi:putative transposase
MTRACSSRSRVPGNWHARFWRRAGAGDCSCLASDMELSDRIFTCQNRNCPYALFPQDRDHNAAQNILSEALRLIGLVDQAVTGIGSDEDVNLAVDVT